MVISKNLIVLIGEAVVGLIAGAATSAVIDKAKADAPKIVTKYVAEDRSPAQKAIFDKKNELAPKVREILAKEDAAAKKAIKEYSAIKGAKDAKKRLYSDAETKLNDFRTALDYEGNSERIKSEANAAIKAFKERNNYDSQIAKFDADMGTIRTEFDNEKSIIKLGVTDEETRKELIKNLKQKRNRKIDEIETKKNFLVEKVSAFEERTNRNAANEIGKIEAVIDRKKKELYSAADKEYEAIQKDLSEYASRTRSEIVGARTADEKDIFTEYEQIKTRAEGLVEIEETIGKNAADMMSTEAKVGQYLAEHDISKATVWFFGLAPVVFVVHLTVTWIFKVAKVASSMT